MNAFNNTNYYKAKDSFETLLQKYPASPYNSEVAPKLAIAKRKVAEIDGEARKIKQTAMALSVLELMSNKTKYANEKVTIEGYIFSNFSFNEEFSLTDEPHNFNPSVDINYGTLSSDAKKQLLPLQPGRSTWRVTVVGFFNGADNIQAIECVLH